MQEKAYTIASESKAIDDLARSIVWKEAVIITPTPYLSASSL